MSLPNHCVVCAKLLPNETKVMCCKECLYKRPGRFIPVEGNPPDWLTFIERSSTAPDVVDIDPSILPPCPHPWCGTGKIEARPEDKINFSGPGDPDKFPERKAVELTPAAQNLLNLAAKLNETPIVPGMIDQELFYSLLDSIKTGGDPEIVDTTPERLYKGGWIGFWEFQWLRLKRLVGTLRPSATSGVLSVLQKHGITLRVLSGPTRTLSGTSSSGQGEPSTFSGPIPPSLSGYTTQSTTLTPGGTKVTFSHGESGPSQESPSSTRSPQSSPEDTARP